MRTSKKQIVKELKRLLDKNRTRIERVGFKFVDSEGNPYKREPLFMNKEGVTYSKPYASRLFIDVKYTKKSWNGIKK